MSVIQYIAGIASVFLAVFALRRIGDRGVTARFARGISVFRLEYLVLGIILSLVLPDTVMGQFEAARSPLIMFCISWAGFFFGCGLELRTHQAVPGRVLLMNLLEPLTVFAVVTFLGSLFLFFRFDGWQYTGVGVLTGAFSSFMLFPRNELSDSGTSGTFPVPKYLLPLGNLVPVLLLTSSAAILFGGDDVVLGDFVFTGTLSVLLVQCLIGIGCGMILNMLVAGVTERARTVTLMIGVTALGGGMAYAFSLSPLFIGTLSGAFVINASLKRLQVLQAASRANSVIEILFLFLLGTLITPLVRILETDTLMISAFAITLVAARVLIKEVWGWVWSTRVFHEPSFSPGTWAGFAGQGMLAAAAAVESALQTGLLPAVFFLFITVLLLNQAGMGLVVITRSSSQDSEEADNA